MYCTNLGQQCGAFFIFQNNEKKISVLTVKSILRHSLLFKGIIFPKTSKRLGLNRVT